MNYNRVIIRNKPTKYDKVLYLMTKAFRVNDNHSLEYALSHSNKESLSIYLYRRNEDNPRNNDFFEKGIANFIEVLTPFSNDVRYLNEELDTEQLSTFDCIITDMMYLYEDRLLDHDLLRLCKESNIGYITVETNVVVPVRVTSSKEEYSARTIRPKIWKWFPDYVDLSTEYQSLFTYEQEALMVMETFIDKKLKNYHLRNNPENDYTSSLSVYLKYGFISPLTIYKKVWGHPSTNVDAFLEELIVRRDLSYNFVYFNQQYYQFNHMTYDWAYQTMHVHELDQRDYLYTIEDYLSFNTHDPYFNAAMKEMVYFGTMKGYMRMYWAKKIIEWSKTYQEAYQTAMYLNNYYFLDGNTPNGYAGVAWCFGKHDRAWTERPIFGKLRYMNDNGLKRKFDIEQYINNVEKKVRGHNE